MQNIADVNKKGVAVKVSGLKQHREYCRLSHGDAHKSKWHKTWAEIASTNYALKKIDVSVLITLSARLSHCHQTRLAEEHLLSLILFFHLLLTRALPQHTLNKQGMKPEKQGSSSPLKGLTIKCYWQTLANTISNCGNWFGLYVQMNFKPNDVVV